MKSVCSETARRHRCLGEKDDAGAVLWSQKRAGTQQCRPLCVRIRNLNFSLQALGDILTSCQKIVCFSNALKYIPGPPAVLKREIMGRLKILPEKRIEPCILPALRQQIQFIKFCLQDCWSCV